MAPTDSGSAEAFGGKLLPLVGTYTCLDLVNTLNPRKGERRECLHGYADLVRWGAYAGLFSSTEAAPLSALAATHPDEAERVFYRALDLRETLYNLFYAVSQGNGLPETDAARLRDLYTEALTFAHMAPVGERFGWLWPGDGLEAPLYRLAHNAVELLRTGEPARLKECANPVTCGWLFYDTSKNNRRRWCLMSDCGVADKVRQQRRRRARTAKD